MATQKLKECPVCFGCGHLCERCADPINVCRCDFLYGLDTEEMMKCRPCNGTGQVVNVLKTEAQGASARRGVPYASA